MSWKIRYSSGQPRRLDQACYTPARSASRPSHDCGICFGVEMILISSALANRSVGGETELRRLRYGRRVGPVVAKVSISERESPGTYPHTPAGCFHSRSHCGRSRCTRRTGWNTVRSCIFPTQTSRTRLHLKWERVLGERRRMPVKRAASGHRTYEGTVVFHRGRRHWQQSTAMRAQFVKVI